MFKELLIDKNSLCWTPVHKSKLWWKDTEEQFLVSHNGIGWKAELTPSDNGFQQKIYECYSTRQQAIQAACNVLGINFDNIQMRQSNVRQFGIKNMPKGIKIKGRAGQWQFVYSCLDPSSLNYYCIELSAKQFKTRSELIDDIYQILEKDLFKLYKSFSQEYYELKNYENIIPTYMLDKVFWWFYFIKPDIDLAKLFNYQ